MYFWKILFQVSFVTTKLFFETYGALNAKAASGSGKMASDERTDGSSNTKATIAVGMIASDEGTVCYDDEHNCYNNKTGNCKEATAIISKSLEGYTCQRWDKQSPHIHYYPNPEHNYCRLFNEQRPWCFTTDVNKRWDWCVEDCDSPHICNIDADKCYNTKKGNCKETESTLSKTLEGFTCQSWDKRSPHKHNFTLHKHNYCRLFHERRPWCYTTDIHKRWDWCVEECGVKHVCYEDEHNCYNKKGNCKETNATLSKSLEGYTCQRWDKQSPHKHGYANPEHNYCRLFDAQRPWCYTTDVNKRWDWCVEECNSPYIPTSVSYETQTRVNTQPVSQPNVLWKQLSNKSITIRVMSFNVWNGGKHVIDGAGKILKQIKFQQPDIVLMQECVVTLIVHILQSLGNGWQACDYSSDTAIITRFPIVVNYSKHVSNPPGFVGCKVLLRNYPAAEFLNLWNVHLDWRFYGPYAACQKGLIDSYKLDLCERGGTFENKPQRIGRLQDVYNLMKHPPFWDNLVSTDGPYGTPIILGGDFNSPSHLDWIEQTKSEHCDWSYNWPVSNLLANYGFEDSFRKVYPNPVSHPGTTWSPIYKYMKEWSGIHLPEIQDRIDYIYTKGEGILSKDSWITHGQNAISLAPNYKHNDWPSDHAAVVTNFEVQFM